MTDAAPTAGPPGAGPVEPGSPQRPNGERTPEKTPTAGPPTAGPPGGRTTVIAALWITSALNLLYWVSFFTNGAVRSSQDPVYLGFEAAFPAADAWLGIASIACAEGLRRRRPWGVLFGIAAGSAWVYLGCMDALYSLEHGMYAHLSAEMLGEIGIEIACFTFGPFLMWYVWRHRRWLEGGA